MALLSVAQGGGPLPSVVFTLWSMLDGRVVIGGNVGGGGRVRSK